MAHSREAKDAPPARGQIEPEPVLVALAVFGIALAIRGQAQTTRHVASWLSWLVPYAADLTDVYPHPKSVVAGALLLAAGALMFALATSPWSNEARDDVELDSPGRGFAIQLRADWLALAAFGAGAVPLSVVLVRLGTGHYSHWLIIPFALSLGLLAVPFALRDSRLLSMPKLRLSRPLVAEVAFVAAMMGLFISLNLVDLTHWRFSAEGDEYAFFERAKAIANGAPFNIFFQNGVYGYHPVLSTAYQASFMKVLNADIFAWKLSLVILIAVTLVPFYLLMRELFATRVAMLATGIAATSHVLFAFTHTGFDNLTAILPTVLALWLLVVGLRRDSTLALFASGAAAGMGLYVFYSSRATILIIGLFLLLLGRRGLRAERLLPIAIAFAVVAAPIFTIHGWDVIDQTIGLSSAEAERGGTLARLGHNIVPSLMAFNYSPNAARYVSGSLLDPLSAVLFAMGLAVALTQANRPALRLMLVWFAVGLVVTGFFTPIAEVPVTRLNYLVLPAAALAGLAFDRTLSVGLQAVRAPPVRATATAGCLVALLVPILYLNLHRFWYETPRADPTSFATVIMRAVLSDECEGPQIAIVSPYTEGFLVSVLAARDMGVREPLLLPYDSTRDGGLLTSIDWPGCLIVNPDAGEARLAALLRRIRNLFPEKTEYELADLHGSYDVTVFR